VTTPATLPSTLVLGGPTASGKTSLAVELARRMDAEIICADAMQVYRGLDQLTAKPGPVERAAVPHHCLDLVTPSTPFSVAEWLAHASAAERDIHARGRRALVTGGTGLYLRAFRHGLDPAPRTSPEERAEFDNRSLDSLVMELCESAPAAARVTDLCNRRRVERALVLIRAGIDPTARESFRSTASPAPLLALRRDPADLAARITARARELFRGDLPGEFARAVALGVGPGTTAWQTLGCRELAAWAAGEIDALACETELIRGTRQYARRQMTWLRRERGVIWLDAGPAATPGDLADRALQLLADRLDTPGGP
jgi:tRNA dimethylallyltransferase